MELDREEDGDGLLKSPKFQGLRYMEPAEKMQLIKFKLYLSEFWQSVSNTGKARQAI
jgi:hypothetical protein